jgi:hypothetical protein
MATLLNRRHFTLSAVAALAWRKAFAQSARTSVAELERDRVLTEARFALDAAPLEPSTLTVDSWAGSLRELSATIACLAAAYTLTKESKYANRAVLHLRAWFNIANPYLRPSTDTSVADLVPLAEIARATSFLIESDAYSNADQVAVNTSLTSLQHWLQSNRSTLIERDSKDHRASCWLLLSAAIARSQRDEEILTACRQRLRKPTLRNQIDAKGGFPQELATPNPYRNTLYNFDLLTGACQLLSTPFEDLWSFELIDGISLRTVAAALYPVIADPSKWAGVSDAQHFRELPGRRPALLFTGRAYNRPEYVELWQSLPALVPPDIAASFPIREPLLWTTRALHGL